MVLALGCGDGGTSTAFPVISSFKAEPAVVASGSNTFLTAVFDNGTGTIDHGVGPVLSGNAYATAALTTATTFTLTVTNSAGAAVQQSVQVGLLPQNPITSFTNNGPVTAGSPATLTAVFTSGTGLVNPGSLPILSGKPIQTGVLSADTTFTLTVTGATGDTYAMTTAVAVSTAMNQLNLSITGLPSGQQALVDVWGPAGLISNATASANFPSLASGAYAVVPAGLWGTGALAGQVFQAAGGLSRTLKVAETVNAAIVYTAATSLTVPLPEATQPGSSVPLVLVPVPAGTYLMGAFPGEEDGQSLETPQHAVTLSRPFYLAEDLTTQAQWLAIMGSNPASFCVANGGATTDNLARPVESVSWNEVTAFLNQLNAATAASRPAGMVFRLPTEAEWEYACRAGTTTRFYWGDDAFYTLIDHYAWWSQVSETTTHPVGSLGAASANPWGLFDMNGNVFEWCQDWYGLYTAGAQTDPGGPVTGTDRVVRGGAWYYGDIYCRSANRSYSGPDDHYASIGFRLVLAPAA